MAEDTADEAVWVRSLRAMLQQPVDRLGPKENLEDITKKAAQ